MQTAERTEEEYLPDKEHAGGDFLAVMLRRKWVVLLFVLVGGGAGWLSYEHTPAVFQARSQVLITRREAGFQSMANGHSDYEDLVSRDILSTQSMVIRSEMVVGQAVKLHKLNTLRSFGANASVASTAAAIIRGLAVTKGGDNLSTEDANVLNVSFRGSDKADCPKILNAVLDSYQTSLGEDSKEGSQQTLELFRHVSEVLDKQLQQLEGDYNEWRKSAPLIFSGNKEGVNPHYARLTDIEGARSKGRLRLSEIRAHVQTIEEALKSGVLREALKLLVERSRGTKADTKTASASMIEQQLFQLMMEEQLQIENFGSDHPKVKVTRKQIQVLQDLLLGSRGGQTAGGRLAGEVLDRLPGKSAAGDEGAGDAGPRAVAGLRGRARSGQGIAQLRGGRREQAGRNRPQEAALGRSAGASAPVAGGRGREGLRRLQDQDPGRGPRRVADRAGGRAVGGHLRRAGPAGGRGAGLHDRPGGQELPHARRDPRPIAAAGDRAHPGDRQRAVAQGEEEAASRKT